VKRKLDIIAGIALSLLWFAMPAGATPRPTVVPAQAARYRAQIIREARAQWGLDAPVAVFAAQIHQESRWREDARSPVGALGIAQFMPGTAAWMAKLYPAQLGDAAPLDPGWAIRALVYYNKWNYERLPRFKAEGWNRMAAALSAYNGGLGWIQREARLARADATCGAHCATVMAWWDCVERFNARSQAAWDESRGYPRRILLLHLPAYKAAGW